MIKPQARVDKFEGSNRYETAALIAREYAGLTRDSLNSVTDGKYDSVAKGEVNIVLVNGDALVDGLAAAPLAAAKENIVRDHKHGRWVNTSAPVLLTRADSLPRETKAYLREVLSNIALGDVPNVTINLVGGETVNTSAPVLLTRADSLPRETKAYLREVLSNIALGDVPNVTINLVGGETVLTRNLEKELKAIGFKGFTVERFGGDNREATSLEVAKEIGTDKAFVVGGEGEADAMSIAAVAATQKTPIIVAKKGGISEDGLYEVRDRHVTIVGGNTVVTSSEEKEIRTEAASVNRIPGANRKATNAEVIKRYYNKSFANGVGNAQNVTEEKEIRTEAASVNRIPGANRKATNAEVIKRYYNKSFANGVGNAQNVIVAKDGRTEAASVNRIPGANRKATNAEVIKRYYNKSFANGVGNAQNVIVAKDGQRREIDLVDALAAANMASEKKAPIVLATNKLSKEQEAAINSYANDAYGLFQVGGQVERSVVKMASEKKAPIVLATNKLSKEQEAAINSYANDAYGLFQVGGQVERSVVKTIAKMLNLTNRNTK